MNELAWLDRTEYPFASHFTPVEAGRLHYIDEGDGPPIVLLHGNPTWSFLYRHLIRRLSNHYRCVAPDYVGFGLSDKPLDWSYAPQAHVAHVETLIRRLDLRDITLVVHDWGGPIGLSYALRHPDNVRRLVLTNTWLWPLHQDGRMVLFSRLMGGSIGRILIDRYNAFARFIVPLVFGDRSRLSDLAYRHYWAPLYESSTRRGSWAFPRALLADTEWLTTLWSHRHALADKPALIVWGMKDPAFRPRYLRRWTTLLPEATVHRLPTVGHYVAEEAGSEFPLLVADFLEATD